MQDIKVDSVLEEKTEEVNLVKKEIKYDKISFDFHKKCNFVFQMKTLHKELDHLKEVTKVKAFRSCEELRQQGLQNDGDYPVDPDGELVGEKPIQVSCEADTGTTVVGGEMKATLEACEGDACSKIKFNYTQSMSQMKALIGISETCSQNISFRCFGSPLKVGTKNLGYWLDHHCKKKYFSESRSI